MNIKNEEKFTKLSSVCDINCESTAEYTLPDYQGDVRKILFIGCQAKPAGKFSDEVSDEFPGSVEYDVLYLDSDGIPTRASFTSEYDLVSKKTSESCVGAFAHPVVSGFNVRLTGPRKFTARATVATTVRSVCEDQIAAFGNSFEKGCESLNRVLHLRSIYESTAIEREYAERVERLDGTIADEVRILYSGADVVFGGVEMTENGARITGDLNLYCVLSVNDAPLYFVEKTVPIDELVSIDNGLDAAKLIPEATVQSVVATVNADESGSEVVLSAVVEFSVCAEYNEMVNVMADAYLVDSGVENTYGDYKYTTLEDAVLLNEAMSCEVKSEKICGDKIREIPFISVVPRLEIAEAVDSGIRLKGEIRASGIASLIDGDGDLSYGSIKFSVPFEKTVRCKFREGENIRSECNLNAMCATAKIDSDCIRLNYKLCGSVIASSAAQEKILVTSSSTDTDSTDSTAGRIVVYYPTKGETLFSVAKKFRKPVAAIAEKNDLSASVAQNGADFTLAGVENLIIY